MRRFAPARLPVLVLAAAGAVALAGCAADGNVAATGRGTSATASAAATPAVTSAADCAGVFVTVQFGLLGADDVNACDPATRPVTASAALNAVGVTTEGTKRYGDQVVCRVNGEPSASEPVHVPGHPAYTETCDAMPASFAYWAMWVRDSATGKWRYAQNGVDTEQLKPGQTLGLKFTTGSDTTAPTPPPTGSPQG